MERRALTSAPSYPTVHNRALFALCIVAWLVLGSTSFIGTAPNRLADALPHALWQTPSPLGHALLPVAVLLALTWSSFSKPSSKADWIACLLAVLFTATLLIAAGGAARDLTLPGHPAQRQVLGPAFWIGIAIGVLAALDAMRRLKLGVPVRGAVLLTSVAIFAGFARMGIFDALSLSREFASHRPVFAAALIRHIVLVGAALALSILLCAPLLGLARRGRKSAALIYTILGLVQTIPSIALFGLLITPLTALAERVPVLKSLGVSGLGTTPALIALVLYAAFPLVRSSDAAFSAVPAEVAEAARGLGFSRSRRFFSVDLPLALPILLSGLRVVALQAIGLATVAALIGGGGLGTFIFEGIGEYALDLVLVGALPVILLALLTDFGFRVLEAAVETRP